MSRETVRMARLGIRPRASMIGPVALAEQAELATLRGKVIALRGDLAMARAQRNANQAALDKANRDNDGLRAELKKERARADDLEEVDWAADRAIMRFISENQTKALVDCAATYQWEDEEE